MVPPLNRPVSSAKATHGAATPGSAYCRCSAAYLVCQPTRSACEPAVDWRADPKPRLRRVVRSSQAFAVVRGFFDASPFLVSNWVRSWSIIGSLAQGSAMRLAVREHKHLKPGAISGLPPAGVRPKMLSQGPADEALERRLYAHEQAAPAGCSCFPHAFRDCWMRLLVPPLLAVRREDS